MESIFFPKKKRVILFSWSQSDRGDVYHKGLVVHALDSLFADDDVDGSETSVWYDYACWDGNMWCPGGS